MSSPRKPGQKIVGTDVEETLGNGEGGEHVKSSNRVPIRVLNRIIFHFPVSEGNNRVDNRIANNRKIIG